MNNFTNIAWNRPAANDRGPGIACAISGIPTPPALLMMLDDLTPSLVERIRRDFPDLAPSALIGNVEVDRYRTLHIEELLLAEHAELTALDRRIVQANWMAGGNGVIDPQPFASLQRVLSSIAALQASVVAPHHPGSVEAGNRRLHGKIDDLISTRWQRMMEIQRLQLESMEA
jgi:hypothetical protein